ncbi:MULTISPECIES: GTPase domain-containing protein [unclassified Corallococcus]|uniref:GTPase domain-containing protein n=1 Tax=unclassified Corallococcus TaxID=2685029 RepID=UPI001A8D579F|nr:MULTISPECIES: GTPase domain-containing protein [unclassified Corallococcus]MBN9685567.1 50S ribosome-binding GTPase [Corallococcus sp. NCSPR001]WAS82985.1 50S ribosome-binding GTPase [Corallococcus sp. NCRR]
MRQRRLRFAEARETARHALDQFTCLLEDAGEPARELLDRTRETVRLDPRRLSLALAGEYSVGKSSLVQALTGQSIAVAAGPTTSEVTFYPFGDIDLVDMPGTLSGQFEHDERARRAIADADLLLYVVTNELFNAASLPYFRMAADRLAKSHQMLLVVNKFDRFNLDRRTPEEAVAFIKSTLAEEIQPLSIEPFGPVVVSARDYVSALSQTDEARKQRRLMESRFDTLFEAIDIITRERGLLGQAARPLQQLLDLIGDARALALAEDPSAQNAEAFLRRKAFQLSEGRTAGRNEFNALCDRARARLVKPCERILKALDSKVAPEEIEALWRQINGEIERVVEETGHEFSALVERLSHDIANRLEELEASPAAKKVLEDFSVDFSRPDLPEEGDGISKGLRDSLLKSARSGAAQIAKNGKEVGEAVAKIYKFLGGKFKPWGIKKLGSFFGEAGKALGPLLVGLEVYLNYREEKAREEGERAMRRARADVRIQFDDAGDQFRATLMEQADGVVKRLYDEPIAKTRELAGELLLRAKSRRALAAGLEELERNCRRAIRDLDA